MSLKRQSSTTTTRDASPTKRRQELSNYQEYDYLAKVVLIGPSGCGKSCLLHRYIKDEWKILSSQTIGVEFASKIVSVGTGSRRKRIKLQLWDTAGTERFRSVSRSYYRGAAGVILCYDISNLRTFQALPTFLHDARALASPYLTAVLAGNKSDIAQDYTGSAPDPEDLQSPAPDSLAGSLRSNTSSDPSTLMTTYRSTNTTVTSAPEGREVYAEDAASWAQQQKITVATEVSALTGDSVEEMFTRLAKIILTRIELGEIDPSDPASGIQYGDSWGYDTIKSTDSQAGTRSRRVASVSWASGLRDWEEVFRVDTRRGRGCC